jgi:arylsulfatase A-like enzyme
MSFSRSPLILPARFATVVLCLSLILLALSELPNIPLAAYTARPFLFPQAFVRVLAESFLYCWVNLLAICALIWLDGPATENPAARRRINTVQVLLAILPAAFAYYLLQLYEPFALYPPFVAAYVGLALLTWLSVGLSKHPWVKRLRLPRGLFSDRSVGVLLLAAALLVSRFNYGSHKGLYPTLHLSALVVTHLLLTLACFRFLRSFEEPFAPAWRTAAKVLVSLVALAPLLSAAGLVDASAPHVTAYTATGQSKVVFHRFQSSETEGRPSLPPDPEALERFASRSGLPRLPESFQLENYNVLLVTSEATRFDRTSLSKNRQANTPQLARFRDSGAFSFTRAYSPSSGTLHSISSVMAMTFPAALHLETYKKPWHGTLLNERPIVPQLFRQSGYDTFWVGHAYRNCFRNNIRGFQHGFNETEYIVESKEEPSRTLDRDIVDATILELDEARAAKTKFFGWVFLGGPHWPYVQHDKGEHKADGGAPEGRAPPEESAELSEHDRYVQEVREMDRQLGRLLDRLIETDLLSDTIVIYFGDHGEEFGEHGGTHHKATVYSEVLHVPLLVYVPGMRGQEIATPVSTYYVFPWLLRFGTDTMKRAAEERIRQEIGPMMLATQGGVVAELIGHDRMLTSLIYSKHKYNHDFLSNMIEIYDLEQDPSEQINLFDTDLKLARRALARIAAYKKVRAARANYILLPEDPR